MLATFHSSNTSYCHRVPRLRPIHTLDQNCTTSVPFSISPQSSLFRTPPWPTLNPLCPHSFPAGRAHRRTRQNTYHPPHTPCPKPVLVPIPSPNALLPTNPNSTRTTRHLSVTKPEPPQPRHESMVKRYTPLGPRRNGRYSTWIHTFYELDRLLIVVFFVELGCFRLRR
jgi:hypothetical protein